MGFNISRNHAPSISQASIRSEQNQEKSRRQKAIEDTQQKDQARLINRIQDKLREETDLEKRKNIQACLTELQAAEKCLSCDDAILAFGGRATLMARNQLNKAWMAVAVDGRHLIYAVIVWTLPHICQHLKHLTMLILSSVALLSRWAVK